MNEGEPMEVSSDVFDDAEEMCMNVAARDVIPVPVFLSNINIFLRLK